MSSKQAKKAKKRGSYRRYTDAERIKVIELNKLGMTSAQIADELGIPETTVRQFVRAKTQRDAALHSELDNDKLVEMRSKTVEQMIENAKAIALKAQSRLINELDDSEAIIPARDLSVIGATAIDKHQLLTGQATQTISANVTIDDADKALLERLNNRLYNNNN